MFHNQPLTFLIWILFNQKDTHLTEKQTKLNPLGEVTGLMFLHKQEWTSLMMTYLSHIMLELLIITILFIAMFFFSNNR